MADKTNQQGSTPDPGGGGQGKRNDQRFRPPRDRDKQDAKKSTFQGKIPELEGYVYDVVTSDPTKSYQKTTEEIAEYIGRTLKDANEFRMGMIELQLPKLDEPKDPEDPTNPVLLRKWDTSWKQYQKKLTDRESNQGLVYGIVLGQCSKAMRDELDARNEWKTVNANSDVIGLLKLIKASSNVKINKGEFSHQRIEAEMSLLNFKQRQLSQDDYYRAFRDKLDLYEQLAGPIANESTRLDQYLKSVMKIPAGLAGATSSDLQTAKVNCRESYVATLFLLNSDPGRHGQMVTKMKNDYVMHGSPYPATLADALTRMKHYEPEKAIGHDKAAGSGASQPNFMQHSSGDGKVSGKKGWNSTKTSGSSTTSTTTTTTNASDSHKTDEDTVSTITKGSQQSTAARIDKPSSTSDDSYPSSYSGAPVMQHSLYQVNRTQDGIPNTWVILDSASSIDMFINSDLLTDIQTSTEPITILSNAGRVSIDRFGYMPGYPEKVWYHPSGAANVLSLRNVSRHFRVTMDTKHNNCLTIGCRHDPSPRLRFAASASGLYYHDTNSSDTNNNIFGSFLTTVSEKKAAYTQRGIQQAQLARRVHDIIMRPATRRYMDLVSRNYIRNCPVDRRHIQAAEDIYGPNVGALCGKTPRRPVGHVTAIVDPVPADVLHTHGEVTLAVDLMFINKVAFLITVSRGLRIGSIHALDNRQVSTVRDSLLFVLNKYERRGFRITTIMADEEFEPLIQLMPAYTFNLCGADEHVPDIERYIRTTKDTIRSAYNELPFQHIPRMFLVRLAENAIFWQNAFPREDSVTPTLSPRYLIEGRHIDYNKHVRIPFGAYAHTHEIHDNTMRPRTIGAICLGPTGNEQGTHYFYSLVTGRVISRPNFTELPMPVDVIQRISNIGRTQTMPPTLTFGNRYGHELHDQADDIDDLHDDAYSYSGAEDTDADSVSFAPETSDSEPDFDSADESDSDSSTASSDPDSDPVTDDEDSYHDDHPPPLMAPVLQLDDLAAPAPDHDPQLAGVDLPPPHEAIIGQDNEHTTGVGPDNAQNTGVEEAIIGQDNAEDHTIHPGLAPAQDVLVDVPPNGPVETTGVAAPDHTTPAEQAGGQRNMRPRRPKRDPTHLLGKGFEDEFIFLTAQMSAKKGLKIFGQPGADAIIAELQQLHYRKVVRPQFGSDMTKEEKRAALHYLMYLKQKRCGKIKARGCADGRKQRLWKSKDETSSPTVRTESVFISAVVDAHEKRHVITCDIPGAFMQADIDEVVHVKFEGEIAELLVKVDPKLYAPYLTHEHGKEVLYVKLDKALYGTLQAALLFWKELSAYITLELGFTINPYDSCVANKMIDGKQCTILWHVDDLKISHVSNAVVEDILARLNDKYGREQPLSVTRGHVHDYLGMTLDYSTPGQVQFTMTDYIDNLLEDAAQDMQGTSTSPAASYLFDVDPTATKLDRLTAEYFHTMVAKLLYLCKRTRPDISTAVAFLTTRVTQPDVNDYGKLRRCVQYLRGTRSMPLTLSSDDLGTIHWHVDASFAVHPDMKSHTGMTMSLGKGTVFSMSTRQKLNTKSSTEAELVGVDDAMSSIIWTRNFMMAQGINVTDNIVYQDNQSAILLAKNGQASSGKRTRHINIRYFFVKDRIRNKELRIEYCPTELMLSDLLTKPLQGSQFRKLRDQMLNICDSIPMQTSIPSQECVKTPFLTSGSNESKVCDHVTFKEKIDETDGSQWTVVESRRKLKERKSMSSHTLSRI